MRYSLKSLGKATVIQFGSRSFQENQQTEWSKARLFNISVWEHVYWWSACTGNAPSGRVSGNQKGNKVRRFDSHLFLSLRLRCGGAFTPDGLQAKCYSIFCICTTTTGPTPRAENSPDNVTISRVHSGCFILPLMRHTLKRGGSARELDCRTMQRCVRRNA